MQEVFSSIRKVATTEVPVLVVGESGTGKELVAGAIHRQSSRKDFPFVVINCGAIPENLLESELFGHEKGSFTDAHIQRKGRFETAQGEHFFLMRSENFHYHFKLNFSGSSRNRKLSVWGQGRDIYQCKGVSGYEQRFKTGYQ